MLEDLPDLEQLEPSYTSHGSQSSSSPLHDENFGPRPYPSGPPTPGPPTTEQINKFIRGQHRPPSQAGMQQHNSLPLIEEQFQNPPMAMESANQQYHMPPSPPRLPNYVAASPPFLPPRPSFNNRDEDLDREAEIDKRSHARSADASIQYNIPSEDLSCIDVANHIASCPICSRLYRDNSIYYIIAICVLVVLLLIAVNKLLQK